MKLVLFLCLVGVCLVAAKDEVNVRYNYNCAVVDCNNCFYDLDDCSYCCKDFSVACEAVNCYECDIKYCGTCCDFIKKSKKDA
ncbi:unnamed protein product [Nezara viridula]|uniref:Neuropeptide n=1 Tax=Nezara viridula TaxID=85310 RepID=A0A9P0HQ47_NEZVI|nr:unnamed protein product [Nezara viridula]